MFTITHSRILISPSCCEFPSKRASLNHPQAVCQQDAQLFLFCAETALFLPDVFPAGSIMDECGVCTNVVLTVFVFDAESKSDSRASIYAYFRCASYGTADLRSQSRSLSYGTGVWHHRTFALKLTHHRHFLHSRSYGCCSLLVRNRIQYVGFRPSSTTSFDPSKTTWPDGLVKIFFWNFDIDLFTEKVWEAGNFVLHKLQTQRYGIHEP